MTEYYFVSVADVKEPGKREMHAFVDLSFKLLHDVLEQESSANRICRNDHELAKALSETLGNDVWPAVDRLHAAIDELSDDALDAHGLRNSAMHFKFRALARLERAWRRYRGGLTVGSGFTKLLTAISAVLGSFLDATNVGTLLKEFVDVILALAPTRSVG